MSIAVRTKGELYMCFWLQLQCFANEANLSYVTMWLPRENILLCSNRGDVVATHV